MTLVTFGAQDCHHPFPISYVLIRANENQRSLVALRLRSNDLLRNHDLWGITFLLLQISIRSTHDAFELIITKESIVAVNSTANYNSGANYQCREWKR